MNKNDWFGLGISVVAHALILLLFTIPTAQAPVEPIGFIEVDVLGPIQEGRTVEQAAPPDPIQDPKPAVEPQRKPATEASAPEESRDVNLPEQERPVTDPETVKTPETPVVSPERKPNTNRDRQEETIPEQPQRTQQGNASGTTGSAEASKGDSKQETRSAPFSLEGLNRTPLRAPLPRNSERVNATIQMRITVTPQGRVLSAIPLRKSNPNLERQVAQVLRTWQFNALPPAAPQENQTGRITFRFTVN